MTEAHTLFIGTSNKGKLHEILEVLHILPYKFVTPTDLGISTDAPEDFDTYAENALQKARFYQEKSGGLLTLAEDSGIVVDALQGELGVKTRRWGAGEKASDEEWIEVFLKRMESVDEDKRTATFLCTAVVLGSDGNPQVFVGETRGKITHELHAPIKSGIPISSCFIPDGFDQVYAALSVEQKNKVSHRGKAMHRVLDYLKEC
jgi:XTP/dITP diphosphohydrolase